MYFIPIFFLSWLALAFVPNVCAQVEPKLFPHFDETTKLYGYIDSSGKLLIPHKYAMAYSFSEGLAAVFIDSVWGYVDTLGRVAISPRFHSAESFSYGRAVVGVVQKRKNRLVSDQDDVDWCEWYTKPAWSSRSYYDYENWNQNCALCPDCFVGVINKTGGFIIEPKYKSLQIIEPGLYKVGKGDCWGDLGAECYYGLVDEKDKNVLKCNFQFSDIVYVTKDRQYFMVQKGWDDYTLKAVIDKNCNVIIPFKYYQIAFGPVIDEKNPITVGLVISRGETELHFRYVFMNLKQEQVITSGFEYASFFIDGVAEVSKDGKPYCIKSNGVLLDYCDDCRCYR